MRSFAETQNGAISSNGRFPFGRVLIQPEGAVRSWGEEEEESPRSFIAASAAAAAIFFSTAASAARSFSGSGTPGRWPMPPNRPWASPVPASDPVVHWDSFV